MYKISVIVPVYNAEPYIVRCMESLRTQTLSDIEVLFVDDRGADNSVSVIDTYIADHALSTDWHVLHTPCNSGPGAARNIGIEAAAGEYIAFVDADDWVEANMYENLYAAATSSDADMAACDAWQHSDDSRQRLSNPAYVDRSYYLSHYVAYLWTYIFRRSFLEREQLRFPSVRSAEDSCFIGQTVLTANRIARVDQPLYHYIVYPASISHRRHVYRGRQKREAFSTLISFARRKGLWQEYRRELIWIYFKKAVVSSIVDYIKSYL